MIKQQSSLSLAFSENCVERLIKFIEDRYDPTQPLVLWVDLFCGCGGVTEGYSQVPNNFIVA